MIFLFLLLCGTLLTATAEDWRQFRGPNGAGFSSETTIPTDLRGSNVLSWRIELPGRGISSPIIVGDRVFVTCSSGAEQERLHVICFRASDGVELWHRQFWATGRTTCHEKISVAAPTPASDGERIFALFSSNDLICLDLDGNLLWLRALMRDYPNASNSLGLSSSPVVVDDVLIAQVETDSDAFVVGIDVRTGLNRWKKQRRSRANWTSPVLLRFPGGKTLVALQSSGGISAIAPGTGDELWSYSEGAATIPSGTVRGDVLFIPSFGITALQATLDPNPPKQLWRSSQFRPGTASPVAVGDRIFAVNDAGVLTCGDATTGARLWQLRLKGPFAASPLAAGDYLYLVNENGLIQMIDPRKPEGELASELDLAETIIGTPSIANGALYFRSDAHLWKFARPRVKVSYPSTKSEILPNPRLGE